MKSFIFTLLIGIMFTMVYAVPTSNKLKSLQALLQDDDLAEATWKKLAQDDTNDDDDDDDDDDDNLAKMEEAIAQIEEPRTMIELLYCYS